MRTTRSTRGARGAVLVVAALVSASCLGATDPVRGRAASVELTIAASAAPPLAADARTTVVTPAVVDVSVTARVAGTVTELARVSVAPDSAGKRVPLLVELGSCLGDGRESCELSIMVRLRAANGAAYDSSTVGPFRVSPGSVLDVPPIRFRATAQLQLVDSVLNVALGRTGIVRVNALDASSQPLAGRALVWRSLDPTIATVDGNGVVSGVSQGRARIEASREGLTVTSLVNATPVEVLQLAASATRVMVGTAITLTPTITVQGGRSTRVLFASSNRAVATVDTLGRVTTVGAGSTVLSVTAVADTTQRVQVPVTVDLFRAAVSARFVNTGSRGVLPGNVYGLRGYSADSVFATGCGDTSTSFAARFDGVDWRLLPTPPTVCPQGIARLADGTLVLIGSGTVHRLVNGAWTTETPPGGATGFLSLATQGNTIYVGAAGGTVLRWNGSWTSTNTGSGAGVQLLSVGADGTLYAAGAGTDARVFRFTGAGWQVVDTGLPALLQVTGLQVESATEVYVGGTATTGSFVHAILAGNAWTTGTINTLVPAPLRSFTSLGSERFAISSVGDVFRLNGGTWAFVHPTGTDRAMIVAAGTSLITAGWYGSSWIQQGGAWRRLSHVPSYTALWGGSPNFIVAGGGEGSVDLYNGTTWRTIKEPGFRYIRAIWGADSSDIWVSATRMFYRLRQGVWDSIPHAFGEVNAFWGPRRDQVWATTSSGAVLQFDGTAWQQVATLPIPVRAMTGVTQPNGSVVMYAGGNGQVFRSTGGPWVSEPTGGLDVNSLYVADSVTAFATTVGNVPIRRVNGQWVSLPPVASTATNTFWIGGTSRTDVYAGGCVNVYHFDGTQWSALPVTGALPPVCGSFGGPAHAVFPSGGFAVGYILRTLFVGVGAQGQTPGIPR